MATEISPDRSDGDEYHNLEPRMPGVVHGTAANHDGLTMSIATTSPNAQTAVCRAVLAAGVDARGVGMVEAHSPGSSVCDPIEYANPAKVYGTEGRARWPR